MLFLFGLILVNQYICSVNQTGSGIPNTAYPIDFSRTFLMKCNWKLKTEYFKCINYHPLRFISRTLSNTSANDWSSSGRPTARDADAHLRVTLWEERPFIPAASFPQDTRHSLIGKIVREVSHIPETACHWNPPRIIMDGKWVKMNVRELRQGLRPWSGGPMRFHNKPGVMMWSLL